MNTEQYREATNSTAMYPAHKALEYLTLGLVSEAGEVAGKYKKVIRGDKEFDEIAFIDEVADCLWYIDQIAEVHGLDIEELMRRNAAKLLDRKERGVIKGDGDDR